MHVRCGAGAPLTQITHTAMSIGSSTCRREEGSEYQALVAVVLLVPDVVLEAPLHRRPQPVHLVAQQSRACQGGTTICLSCPARHHPLRMPKGAFPLAVPRLPGPRHPQEAISCT